MVVAFALSPKTAMIRTNGIRGIVQYERAVKR
jgi:hypothetical protein